MNTTPRKFYAADIPASGQPDKKLSIYKDGFIYEGYYTSGISHSFDLKIICLDHCFKDGQNVTGLYTKKYEVDISAGNGEWESVSAEYFNTCKDEYRRVIATPIQTPNDKKMTPMEELIEQLKKLSPESPMGNDVSKAFHGGIKLAILKAKFLLEAEREYASQQAQASTPPVSAREDGLINACIQMITAFNDAPVSWLQTQDVIDAEIAIRTELHKLGTTLPPPTK